MRILVSALVLLVALLVGATSASAQCVNYSSTQAIGAHNGANVEIMCRGDDACYTNYCYGRCGPGCNLSVLGNAYTSACTNHDGCIKTQMCTYGNSQATAHANCAYLLPAAAGSLANNAWYNGTNWIKEKVTGVWNSIWHKR
jgi:hypothetical protein